MTITETGTSVRIETEVEAPIEHTFRVFTDGIGTWWDPGHHLYDGEIESMTFEPRVGGRIIDHFSDGHEHAWARVLAYEPPRRVVFSWDITTDWKPATDLDKSSEVEVTFEATTPERTHVVLLHRNLDRHGDGWESMRDAVGRGWTLTKFAKVAAG